MTPRYITLRSLRVACKAKRIVGMRGLPITISRGASGAPSHFTFIERKAA